MMHSFEFYGAVRETLCISIFMVYGVDQRVNRRGEDMRCLADDLRAAFSEWVLRGMD